MLIQPILNYHNNQVNFGYRHELKTLYQKGELKIKYGFYGGKLNPKNVSLEHLKPHSKGGKTTLYNLVLATKENNSKRGNQPISQYLDLFNMQRYLNQFKNIKVKDFDGNKYIKNILQTVTELIRGNF